MRKIIVSLVALALPALAVAQENPAPPPASTSAPAPQASSDQPIGIEIAPKVGGILPFSKLGGSWNADLELGWVSPLLNHQLAFVVDTGYAQPTHGQKVTDARVGGGSYNFTLTQRELNVFVGPKYFIAPVSSELLPYVGAGVKVHLLKSDVVGDAAGSPFGQNSETSTQVGGALRGGLGIKLGPGHLIGELELAYGGLNATITGKSNVADASLQLGYLFIF